MPSARKFNYHIAKDTGNFMGYLSLDAINYIAAVTGIAPAKIYGVATFYAQLGYNQLESIC